MPNAFTLDSFFREVPPAALGAILKFTKIADKYF